MLQLNKNVFPYECKVITKKLPFIIWVRQSYKCKLEQRESFPLRHFHSTDQNGQKKGQSAGGFCNRNPHSIGPEVNQISRAYRWTTKRHIYVELSLNHTRRFRYVGTHGWLALILRRFELAARSSRRILFGGFEINQRWRLGCLWISGCSWKVNVGV